MFETSQREAFCDASKALKSVLAGVWGAHDAPPDPLVGCTGETPFFPLRITYPPRSISNDKTKKIPERRHSTLLRPFAVRDDTDLAF